MITLSQSQWRDMARRHAARVEEWTLPHLERRRRNIAHPVWDFLFDYYNLSPAKLRQWHPGHGVALTGDVRTWASVRGYRVDGDVAHVDPGQIDHRIASTTLTLLRATADREAGLGCFGRHEWAMVYRQSHDEIRHSTWPLRLPADGIAEVVESATLRCTHFDAFRFYTDAARPLNTVQPTRSTQPDLEQPGCLHATMDLYKWAYRNYPVIGADVVADAFALAREVRAVDMQASPYDLSDLGFTPIAIETAEGRAEYVRRQRDFALRGQHLRQRLIESLVGVSQAQPAPC